MQYPFFVVIEQKLRVFNSWICLVVFQYRLWKELYEKGKIIYKVTFGTEGNKEVDVRIDAINGTLLSVKFDN